MLSFWARGRRGVAGRPRSGEHTLSRRQALPLAVGSIAGSGVLFLPSTVYVAAGRDSAWVWLLAPALCLPMLLLFDDVVRGAPPGRAMEWLIGRGLGAAVGRAVPPLFLAIVVLGLPAGALVAGAYARHALGGGPALTVGVAAAVLLVAVGVNLAGARASTRVQATATGVLIVVITLLVAMALAHADLGKLAAVRPGWPDLGVVLPAVVLAFWAFAGFENLTFLSAELRRPDRDLLPVSFSALLLYGGLTVALTLALAVSVPRRQVDELTGLVQIADRLPLSGLVVGAVVATAFLAMVMNAVAWTWGVSRLVARAAEDGLLPRVLVTVGSGGVPRRAVALLGVLFAATGAAMSVRPDLIVTAIAAAGSTFLLLYGLCILAYLRVRRLTARSVVNLLPLAVIVLAVGQSGWEGLYGVTVMVLVLTGQAVRESARKNRRPVVDAP